jgi:hypothetical protein
MIRVYVSSVLLYWIYLLEEKLMVAPALPFGTEIGLLWRLQSAYGDQTLDSSSMVSLSLFFPVVGGSGINI